MISHATIPVLKKKPRECFWQVDMFGEKLGIIFVRNVGLNLQERSEMKLSPIGLKIIETMSLMCDIM